ASTRDACAHDGGAGRPQHLRRGWSAGGHGRAGWTGSRRGGGWLSRHTVRADDDALEAQDVIVPTPSERGGRMRMARSERVILARGDGKTLNGLRQQLKRGRFTHVYRDDPDGMHVGEILVDTLQVRKQQLTARVEWQQQGLLALPPQDEQMAIEQGLDAALAAAGPDRRDE